MQGIADVTGASPRIAILRDPLSDSATMTVSLVLARYGLMLALTICAWNVSAHSYSPGHMTILHPWTDPTPAGTQRAVLSLRIVEIQQDDYLIGAETPVAERIELVQPGVAKLDVSETAPRGIPLIRGQDLSLESGGAHLVLHGIKRDLLFGYEFPLLLHFERAGAVEAGLVISDPE